MFRRWTGLGGHTHKCINLEAGTQIQYNGYDLTTFVDGKSLAPCSRCALALSLSSCNVVT